MNLGMVINILKHHLPLIRLYMYIVQVAHKVQSRHMKKDIKKKNIMLGSFG